MNKNVSWLRLIFIWMAVAALTLLVYNLVRIQSYNRQQGVIIQQTLEWGDAQEGPARDDPSSANSLENTEDGPISLTSRSALFETSERYWNVFDVHRNEVPLNQWMTLLVQNRLKIDLSITPGKSRGWEWAESGSKIRVRFRSEMDAGKDILSRKKQGKYSVQLTSLDSVQFETAISWLQRLNHQGYYSYIQRTDETFEKRYRYRVRVGFFKNSEDALETGLNILSEFGNAEGISKQIWPVIPDSREFSRELIDLKQPRNKPWILELPLYDNLASALKDLASFAHITNFSYLSRKIQGATLQHHYRLRIGFYENRREARIQRKVLSRRRSLFKKAKPLHL